MKRSAVPLRYRLPNPPPHFVGRNAESAALAGGIRRSAVSVVWGLGGSGKTALVLQTLRRRFPKAIARTLLVALRPNGSAPDVEVARVLGSAVGERIDWSELAADPEVLAGAAIDLAESGPWWIALEDLQHADAARVTAFLSLFGRYSRRSRLIATSRLDPGIPAAAGFTLALGAMTEDDLVHMARRVRPLAALEAREAARACGGSPWRLLQRLSGHPGRTEGDDLGLPPALESYLAALSLIDVPVPRSVLDSIAPPPEPIEALVKRGLLDSTGSGFRVHDVVRGMLPHERREEALAMRGRVGAALVTLPDPASVLEGARLLLAAGLHAQAAPVLTEWADDLLASGFGPRLWTLVQAETDPRLAPVRLRCAVDLGTTEALASVRLPAAPSLQDELEWARARRLAHDFPGAAKAAMELQRKAMSAGEARIAFEAGLVRGRCLVQGAPREVLQICSELAPTRPEDVARRDALAAQALAYLGRTDDSLAMAASVRASLPRLTGTARLEVGCAIARVLYDESRLDESASALQDVLDHLGAPALLRFHGRLALHLLTAIAQDRGRIREARALLARLEPIRGSSFLQGATRSVEANLRLAEGDLQELDAFLDVSVAEAEGSANFNYRAIADGARIRLATLLGRPAATSGSTGVTDPVIEGMTALWRSQNAQRHRLPLGPPPAQDSLAANAELRILARIVASETALLAGNFPGALADARTAVDWAREAGLGLAESDALLALCDALLAAGEERELKAVAKKAEALAASMPSARLGGEAQFHRVVLAGSPAALEPLARSVHAPVAARRARALLGEHGARNKQDLLDGVILGAVTRRPEWAAIDVVHMGTGGPEPWGIDEIETEVWVDTQTIPFANNPLLFKLLSAIADRGGSASKEYLVHEVWGESEYHRLKHDNRLHLAVLKIRRTIEEDSAKPTRLLATADGYALSGMVRRRKKQKPG